MSIQEYLAPERCILRNTAAKGEALKELAQRMAGAFSDISVDVILDAVMKRERDLNTRIAPGVALPHARLAGLDRTLAAVLVSARGVNYDPSGSGFVHVVVMVVGGDADHLRALAVIAETLQRPDLIDQLRACRSGHAVYRILTGPEKTSAADLEFLSESSRAILLQSVALAGDLNAGTIMVHSDFPIEKDADAMKALGKPMIRIQSRVSMSSGVPRTDGSVSFRLLDFPFSGVLPHARIDLALLLALTQGFVRPDERVVNVIGFTDPLQLDAIVLSDVDRMFRLFFDPGQDGLNDLDHAVIIRMLQVATELAEEGREGAAVGALFVLGDDAAVLDHCQQMVMNPFKGYDEQDRSIMDPGLTETIKEFSHIDGAMIVRGDGVILSAGAYLSVDHPIEDLPKGLGTRHAAAAGISAVTGALAMVLSQSTRRISLFRSGKCILVV